MANNSNRIIDRYKSYITKSQRKKLQGMYPGYRQTTADELREQYLDNRRSMGRTGAVASAYGLGEGYIARKQADLDRVTDRYALQLGQQADSSFERQVVDQANQTIKARNEAARKAYERKLAAAKKKQAENDAAYKKYLRDKAAYEKALKEYNRQQKTSKNALRSGGAAKSINTANALEAWDAAHGEYYDPRFGRAGVYGSSGNVYSMPKSATPRNAWYEYYDPRFGRTGNYGSPDYGSAAPKQEDVVKRKKQAVMGTVTKPVFTVNPKVKMPVEPKMQKLIDAQVAEIEANPPAEIEKLKLNLTQEYERATSEYKDVLDATQFEASYGAQAQQLMTRYKELEQMARDTRYTPEQRRDYARTMQGIQQQYAQLTSYFKANVPHIHRSMEDLNRRYSELQVKRGVLAALGVTLDDQTLALNGSWLRQGNAIPTVQDRRFWEHAQDVSVAFDDNGKVASVIYNKPGTKEWFDENGYADFIKTITDSYTLSPEEIGGKDNMKTLSELADYNDAIKSNPEAAKEYLRRREYQSVLQEARMHPNEFRKAIAAGEAKTGLSKGLEYGRKHIANHEMTAADIVASPFGMDKKSYFTSSLEKKLDLPKGYLSGNIYKVMTDEDIAFINYCYGTGNEQAAKEYLYELTEWGNSVAAEKRASKITGNENAPEAIKAIREFLWQTGFGAGSLTSNVQDIFASEARPTSEAEATASRITQSKVERGWSPFWASTVDSAAQSFGNNAASALVGAAFGGAGSKLASITMGLSAAGQAKMETLRQGYGDGAATVYGILNGVSEAILQEKVGGLVGFGDRGVFTKVFANAVNKIDSPVLRALINQGLDILSEIGEEEFGNIVDNINRSVALGEKRGLFDGFAEQAKETAVSTAISTILLNALHIPAQIRNERGYSSIAKASGMSLKDAKLLLETDAAIKSGDEVDPKDLSRYNELTAVLTAAMPENVAKAIADGKMTVADWVTSNEGVVQGKLGGKLTEAERTATQTEAVDHTETLKGKTDEQKRDYLLTAAPTGKVGSAYYTTADGKAIQFRNLNTTQKANYVLAQKCAKAFEGSVDVVIHDTLPLSNGAMVGSDGKLHIALDVTNAQGRESIAYWTLAHEAGHALKIADGKAWNEMFNVLTDYAKNFKDRDSKNLYDALVDSVTNQYKYDSNSDAFNDEMFSLIAERMVGSKSEQWAATLGDRTIFDVIANDRNASAKAKRGFLGKLKSSVEKLSRQFRDGGFSKERKHLAKIREQLTEAYKRINEAPSIRDAAVARQVERKAQDVVDDFIKNRDEPATRQSLRATDTPAFKEWFGKSKVINDDGTPKVVYHQTAKDFWTFNTDNPVAGQYDSETPNGIFFKDNDHDIGIGGSRQMAVYLSMQNPLHFKNREEANRWYQKNIDGYAELQDEMNTKLKPIDDELQRIENEMFAEDTTDEQYAELDKEWNEKLEEMRSVENDYRGRLRELLNEFFIKNDSGYDGIILDYDGHRYVDGKRENVKSYIVFKNTQVKSATDNIGTFDKNNPDIRYQNRATDTEYLSLAEKYRDGTATEEEKAELEKRVEEAARKAGYTVRAYHGTSSKPFTRFDRSKGVKNDAGWLGAGYYFYGEEIEAFQYADGEHGHVMPVFLRADNPYFASSSENTRLAEADSEETSQTFTNELIEDGYDSVYYNGDLRQEWVVFDPSQIKSADPVTYDDNGDIIPLSERFRTDREGDEAWKNEDIRYSLKNTQTMSWDEQMNEYFSKNHGKLKSSDVLYVGNSGNAYKNFGMDDRPVGMGQFVVNKAMRPQKGSRSAHGLSEKAMRLLGKGITNPVAVADNPSRNCVYVFTGDANDKGEPVVAIIGKNTPIDYAEAHRISSVYAVHDPIAFLRDHIPQNSRIEVNKKTKLTELLLGNGVPYAELGTILGEFADVIVNDSASLVNPISQEISSASLTDDRISDLIKEYGASGNYAKAYVTSIDPRDFLRLTVSDDVLDKWNAAEGKHEEIFALDEDKLRSNRQTPYLNINHETGEVEGHEGRHRMRALWKAGITSVPIAIVDTANKYGKTVTDKMTVSSQDFGEGSVNGGYSVTLRNLIPTNEQYREQITRDYGGEAKIRYQQRDFRIDFNVPQLDTKALHEAVKGGEGTVENRFEVKYEKTDSGFAVHITDRDSGKTYDRAETVTEGNAKAEAERAAAAVIRNIKRGKPDSTSRSTAGIYIEPGANAARSSAVPVSYEDENGNIRRNSKVARTMIEAGWMTDEQAERFADQVHDGIMSYEPVTNAEAKAYAEKQVSEHPAAAQAAWDAIYNSFAIPSDKDLAVGYQLMANAANDGDFDMMLKLGTELREMMTKAGQAIQSMNLLKQMGAVADVYRIDRAVQKMNDDLVKAAKGYFVTINPNLVEALLKTKPDTQEYNKALDALYKDIASQIKPSLSDALTEYRYLAMLGNPRTHIRNLVGNAVFMPAVAMKNVFGAILEGIRYGNNSAMKTKVLAYGKQYGQFAKEDWGKVKTTIKSTGNKYRDMMSDIDNYRNHFGKGLGWLDKVAKANSKLLEGEDMLFKQAYYRTALAAELSAKKVNLNDLRAAIEARDSGAKMQKDSAEFKLLSLYEEARARAIKEANVNTYNDANKFARDLNAFSRGGGKLRHMMVEGLLPFKNTPANIVSRSIEYSPVGLINSVTREAVKLHKGQIGANEFFDKIARGFSGSAIFALGVWLAKAGVLVGPLGDDKEDKEKKRRGHQAFSIEIAGKSYTLDWVAPVCIPLFTGVALYEMFEKDGNGEHWSQYAMNALTGMLEPITKMSMLEGIENLIDSLAYSDSKLEDAAITVGTSYLTQFIPTLSGQIARTSDKYTRRTYSDKESTLPRLVDKFVQTVQKKIPGWNQSLQPYVNELGEAEKEDNLWLRVFDNFISPGFRSAISNTKLDKELERLGDPSIYPSAASKSFTYNKATYNLHADEYTAFATARGTTAGTLMNSLVDSKAYQGLTDLDQVKAQAKAIEYANAIAKAGILNMRGILDSDIDWDALGSWVPKANEYAKLSDSPTALADYIAIKTYTDGMKADGSSRFGNVADYTVTNKDGTTSVKWNDMKYDYLQSLDLSDKERLFLADAFGIKQDAYGKAEAAVAEVPNLTIDAYTKALDHWQDLTVEKNQKKESLSEAEYEKWLAGNTNAFKKYLNDTKELSGQQKFALLTKIGSSEGWEGKANDLHSNYGVGYDDAWRAAYKASTLTSTDEASKNAQYMAYLNTTNLGAKQKFGLYGAFGMSTSSLVEKATAFATGGKYNNGKNSAAAYGKPSYDALWNAYTAYNGGVQHEAFYDWLSKQSGMNAQQRFACCEFTNSQSAWLEKAVDVHAKMGISYDTLWKIKVYWRNESGQGKKARITAYCKKLGLKQSQIDKLYNEYKFLS